MTDAYKLKQKAVSTKERFGRQFDQDFSEKEDQEEEKEQYHTEKEFTDEDSESQESDTQNSPNYTVKEQYIFPKRDASPNVVHIVYSQWNTQGSGNKIPIFSLTKKSPSSHREALRKKSSKETKEINNITNVNQAFLVRILRNDGFQYGRYINEDMEIKLAEKSLFEDLPENFEFPEGSRVTIEQTGSRCKELERKTKIEFEKHDIIDVKFSLGLPLIVKAENEIGTKRIKKTQKTTSRKIIYQDHFYPKGTILLRVINRKLSPKVHEFFKRKDKNLTIEHVKEFFDTFGVFVNTEVIIGGKLVIWNETEQNTSVSQESRQRDVKLNFGPENLLKTLLSKLWIQGQGKEESKVSLDETNKQFHIQITGGDDQCFDSFDKWKSSLNDPENWKVIGYRKWKYTYKFLPEKLKKQFKKFIEEARETERKRLASSEAFSSKLSRNINLRNCAPHSLAVFDDKLFVFFSSAMQILEIPQLQKSVNVPAPWRELRSAAVLGEFIYASTSEGIYKINPETFEVTRVKIHDREIPMCFILAYNKCLYAFSDSIIRIDPEEMNCSEFLTSGSWSSVSCGLIKKDFAYVVLNQFPKDKIIELNMKERSQREVYNSYLNDIQAIAQFHPDDKGIYIFQNGFFHLNLKNRKSDPREDKKYEGPICVASTEKYLYVASRNHNTTNLNKRIFLYQVRSNGNREPKKVEWSSL